MKQKKQNKKKFLSLNLKWAIGTAVGVFIIFAIYSILLFQSFSSVLLQQEIGYANTTVQKMRATLQKHNVQLTQEEVSLTLGTALKDEFRAPKIKEKSNIFSSMSRENIGISVFNQNKQLVFASRTTSDKLVPVKKDTLKSDKKGSLYIVKEEIRQKKTGKILGYIQVTDRLKTYDEIRSKLMLIFIVLGVTAGLASALLGYVLSAWLLRPIELINETIGKINHDDNAEALLSERVPLLRTHDELEELSSLFNEMLGQMERYITQQQQFVEDVSHELRTPVAIIQGHLDLISRWGKSDQEVLEESIAASLQEINRMKSLVQEMLDLSRAEQIEIQYANENSDAMEVGLQVFENFQMIHADFTFVLDNDLTEPTFVKMYRNHLEQVLIILMDNAVKYSQNRKEVHMSISQNNRFVEIVVQDFGMGISQENLKKIFDRFYRVDKARSRNKGGNGLGLSIARKLVEGYHGNMSVESAEGQGSLFKISIPKINKEAGKN